ncbi:MAG: hypothetical protein V5A72_03565 [Candidatus Nanohaloarchaea archaeon]
MAEGITEYSNSEIVVEEKRGGYNVRVSRVKGDIYAFTRSGII